MYVEVCMFVCLLVCVFVFVGECMWKLCVFVCVYSALLCIDICADQYNYDAKDVRVRYMSSIFFHITITLHLTA